MKYLALLRGINVGGKNVLPMARLRSLFEEEGFQHVQTYIQSGNVLFEAPRQESSVLGRRIEAMLSRAGFDIKVLLLKRTQLERIVADAPSLFSKDKDMHLCDVVYLFPSLSVAKAWESFSPKEGVDHLTKGRGVIYSSRLKRDVTKSRLSKLTQTPAYQHMTIRNWNTTKRLLHLMEDSSVQT